MKQVALKYRDGSLGDPVDCDWLITLKDKETSEFKLGSEVTLKADARTSEIALLQGGDEILVVDLSVFYGNFYFANRGDTITLTPR